MKQPDINRVRKAQYYIVEAFTVIYNIKGKNTSDTEYSLLCEVKKDLAAAGCHLADIICIQEPK